MFRTIDARLWIDPTVRSLPINSHFLFLYLITNPHSHLSGIYYLPEVLIIQETKLTKIQYRYGIDTLSDSGLSKFDLQNEVVWVKNMLNYQGCGQKSIRAAELQLQNVINSPLVAEFCKYYPAISPPKGYRIDRVSESGVKEQEQEREQEQELKASVRSESAPSEDVFTELPCKGNGSKTYQVLKSYISAMKPLYPGIDIEKETLRAKGWLINNPKKGKTWSGMTRFLAGWYGRQQNGFKTGNDLSGPGSSKHSPFLGPDFDPEKGV